MYKLGGATSKVEVLRFVAALAAAKSDPSQRAYLLCDNHSSHRSLEVQAAIKVHFEPLFIPAYSCQVGQSQLCNENVKFNSTEYLFAEIKRQYRKEISRLAIKRDYCVNVCKAKLTQICQDLPRRFTDLTVEANKAYIAEHKNHYAD